MFSKPTIAILLNLLQVYPSVPAFTLSVLFIPFFDFFKPLSLCFTQFGGSFRRLSFDQFRNTAPLIRRNVFTYRSLFNVLLSTVVSSNRASSQFVLKTFKV